VSEPAPVGILLVDKEQSITSHDVVARVRRALGTRKVGHAGTLDPMATGLLVVGVGAATKLLHYLVGLDKEYTATIRLGQRTTTEDADGELLPADDPAAVAAALAAVDDARIAAGTAALTGDVLQRPSSVSAIKVDGRRAYDRVRDGEEVALPPRPVRIDAIEVLAIRRAATPAGAPVVDVDVRVACSSGTYVRAIARDLGDALGVGGHLTALRRTRIGPFAVADAVAVASRERDAPVDAALAARLQTPASAAALLYPTVELDAAAARDLADGKRIAVDAPDAATVAAVAAGRLVGLVEVAGGRARVLMNLPVAGLASTAAPRIGEDGLS